MYTYEINFTTLYQSDHFRDENMPLQAQSKQRRHMQLVINTVSPSNASLFAICNFRFVFLVQHIYYTKHSPYPYIKNMKHLTFGFL